MISRVTTMIDMYDLPTEAELSKAMLEASKKAKPSETGLDARTVFPFWSNGAGHAKVVSDKTGAVKPKAEVKTTSSDWLEDWTKFLKDHKTDGNKPVDHVDAFGSVIFSKFGEVPDTKKVAGSVKALKKTGVTELDGKTTTKVEELGVYKVVTDSNAAKPGKGDHTGIVTPKKPEAAAKAPANLGKIGKPDIQTPFETKTYDSYDATIKSTSKAFDNLETKSELPKVTQSKLDDKTGAVKPKKMEK